MVRHFSIGVRDGMLPLVLQLESLLLMSFVLFCLTLLLLVQVNNRLITRLLSCQRVRIFFSPVLLVLDKHWCHVLEVRGTREWCLDVFQIHGLFYSMQELVG